MKSTPVPPFRDREARPKHAGRLSAKPASVRTSQRASTPRACQTQAGSTGWGRRARGDQMSCRPNTGAPKRRALGACKGQGQLTGSKGVSKRAAPREPAASAARGGHLEPGDRVRAARGCGSRRSLRRQARHATPASALGQVSLSPSSQKQGKRGSPRVPAGSRKPPFSPGHQVNIR